MVGISHHQTCNRCRRAFAFGQGEGFCATRRSLATLLCGYTRLRSRCAPNRSAGRPPRRDFDLPAPREAESRCCVVGRPAWMPGEPCWAKDGPSRRAHGAGPERGTPERSEGRTPGQGLFGSFCGCLTKGTRRKGETIVSVNRECWICTPCDSCFAMRPHLCRVHIHSICHDFLGFRPYGVSLVRPAWAPS